MSRRKPDEFDDADETPLKSPTQQPSFGGTLLAAVGFGLTLIVGGVIGFAAGRPPREADKSRSMEVAQNTPPVVKPPVPAEPQPKPTPEAKRNPEPEPKPKVELEPKPKPKPKVEPKKEPPKVEPKKDPPKPDTPPPAGTTLTFAKDILPIFKAKCNLCHGDAGNPKGDTDLRSLMAMNASKSVKPGKPNESPVWTSIDDGNMPPAGKEKLTDAEKKAIKDWIVAGAK